MQQAAMHTPTAATKESCKDDATSRAKTSALNEIAMDDATKAST
jgi:hypothetical protein